MANLGGKGRTSEKWPVSLLPKVRAPSRPHQHPRKNLSKAPTDELSDLERAASPSSVSATHLSLETVIVTMPQWVAMSAKMRAHTAFSRDTAASKVPHGLATI